MQLKRIKDRELGAEPVVVGSLGGVGSKPPAAGRFFEKKCHFNAIWVTFCRFLELFGRTKLLRFGSQLKN